MYTSISEKSDKVLKMISYRTHGHCFSRICNFCMAFTVRLIKFSKCTFPLCLQIRSSYKQIEEIHAPVRVLFFALLFLQMYTSTYKWLVIKKNNDVALVYFITCVTFPFLHCNASLATTLLSAKSQLNKNCLAVNCSPLCLCTFSK